MRKLIVSMNLSLDGNMSGPQGGLDWHFETWNEQMGEKLLDQLQKADTILLGRITYEAMAKYWSSKPMESNFPRQDLAIADKMNRHTKIVFSKTGLTPIWENTVLAVRDPADEIRMLKHQRGKDLILYGSGVLASALIQSNLVDEYQLWIHPVILGKGTPLFHQLNTRLNLKLRDTLLFDSGVIVISYAPVR